MSVAELLNTEITDVQTIESLPVGAGVVDFSGVLWQKKEDGWWYPASFSWVGQQGALAMAGQDPLLVWLPPEAVGR